MCSSGLIVIYIQDRHGQALVEVLFLVVRHAKTLRTSYEKQSFYLWPSLPWGRPFLDFFNYMLKVI